MNAPTGKVLLSIDTKYTEEIVTEGGLRLYKDPTYLPEWNVTVTGTVVSGEGLEPGSKVLFSYRVVESKSFGSDDEYFVPVVEGDPRFKHFQDRQGREIKVLAFPSLFANSKGETIFNDWAGVLTDRLGNVIDGVQGRESDIDRWLSQFRFGSNEDVKYRNLMTYQGKDYWIADADDVFAVFTKKGYKAVNGYTLCKPLEVDVSQIVSIQNGVHIPPGSVKAKLVNCGLVVASEKIPKNKVAFFDDGLVERYEVNGNNYYVIKESRLLGYED